MANRSIEVALVPTTTEGRFLEVNAFYDEGGPNYFSGGTSARGYYFSVKGVKVEPATFGGGTIRTYAMFTGGLKALGLEVKRFNQKTFDAFAADVLALDNFERVFAHVVSASGLTVDVDAIEDENVRASVVRALAVTA